MKNQLHDLKKLLTSLKAEEYCYLTTMGRVTGNPHEIEIWFSLNNTTLYLMSGDGRSDWVKNLTGGGERNGEEGFRFAPRVVRTRASSRRVDQAIANATSGSSVVSTARSVQPSTEWFSSCCDPASA